jgi:prepilin-type N-terminal cleavage/methylation domain-containing protein
MKIEEKTKGFTLIEMLISLLVITIGVLGVFSAVSKYSQNTQQEKENLVASYLCQEGIEIVKNIRDTNWVSGAAWDAGLTSCASGCETDFYQNALYSWTGDGKNLYIQGTTGFYRYISTPISGDIKTPYTRRINIAAGVNELDVVVNVYWSGKTMTVKENIYNWK